MTSVEVSKDLFLTNDRHLNSMLWSDTEKETETENTQCRVINWRSEGKIKTVSIALVLCLNIGVDPPDFLKPARCARKECWIEQSGLSRSKEAERIGRELVKQYTRWQPRARFKRCEDPQVDEVRRACAHIRKAAGHERVLFHYNGHGTPKPTPGGEIWFFNKGYSQYIPITISDIASILGSPAVYVLDCSAAGVLLPFLNNSTSTAQSNCINPRDNIIFGACGAEEYLPLDPELPADLLTSCLTTPISMSLKWLILQNKISLSHIDESFVERIPGSLTERKTQLGQLNWIFTTITDTIAWDAFPYDTFQKLFRQDLLVASLFRNFLLAERILVSLGRKPFSVPSLPSTYDHPNWLKWDHAAESILSSLYDILNPHPLQSLALSDAAAVFFADQLTAFENWIASGIITHRPPMQLPVVLQVLLSQTYRVRAVVLLKKFLELGSWAVNQVLLVGIFPYVLRLLVCSTTEIRQVLVYVWARIMAQDLSCQWELLREDGHILFIRHLSDTEHHIPSEQKVMASFVLSCICEGYSDGKNACLNEQLHRVCSSLLNDKDPILRYWLCLCLGQFWENFDKAKEEAIQDGISDMLFQLLRDPIPEVRAAATYALGLLIGFDFPSSYSNPNFIARKAHIDIGIGMELIKYVHDGSPLVRRECLLALAQLVFHPYHRKIFDNIVYESLNTKSSAGDTSITKATYKSQFNDMIKRIGPDAYSYIRIWSFIKECKEKDPFPKCRQVARNIIREVNVHHLPKNTNSSTNVLVSLHRDSSLPNMSIHPSQTINDDQSSSLRSNPTTENKEDYTLRPSQSYGNFPKLSQPSAFSNNLYSNISATENDINHANINLQEDVPLLPSKQVPSNLKSKLLEWSKDMFRKAEEVDDEDPLSEAGAARLCRERRNEGIFQSAQELKELTHPRIHQCVILDNKAEMTSLLLFHPYESTLIVTDQKDGVTAWNYQEGEIMCCFANDNPQNTRLTSIGWINEDDISLLSLGSDDGVVKIWTGLHEKKACKSSLVTSFISVPDLIEGGSGLVTHWQQFTGRFYAGGASKLLRLWDLHSEKCTVSLPTDTEACLTCMTSEESLNGITIAGFDDGCLRTFDARVRPENVSTSEFKEHDGWVVNAHVFSGSYEMLSGSVKGDIKFWDLRRSKESVKTIDAHRSPMTALAIHSFAPVFASGSHNQFIKILNHQGDKLGMIRYHDGFLGERIGPVSCLAFHRHKFFLAAGATDSLVAVYTSD